MAREFRQGAVRLQVLHRAVSGELHGAWMSDEPARHGYKISPGTLYPPKNSRSSYYRRTTG